MNNNGHIDAIARRILNENDPNKKEQILQSGVSIINLQTEEQIMYKIEKEFRRKFSNFLLYGFLFINILVLLIVIFSAIFDWYSIIYLAVPKYERFVNQNVILALITGSIAQTAVAFGLLSKFVFSVFDNKEKKN